ncbi:MAG: hypothetical protein H6718_08430 [Polyangiaceae bacterium]|nr:hypothetical protein [Myxococcales bacterium]MCB9585411.1 hypothetical protein [Polyangiaceae bacterium]MCB9606573.1 hypothetical protein [Polyangiaceae bacterium]
MRRSLKKLFALITFGLCAAAATSGCADNESQLFIVGVAIPDGECLVTPDEGTAIYLGGVMDVAFTNTYTGTLLVGNQVTQRGSREETKTETSRIAIRGAEVQIFTPQQQLINEYTVAATGFANQAPNGDAAYGVASVTLIDGATGSTLAGQVAGGGTTGVVVEVRVFGDTLGGSEITSAKLTYPITVCEGCLFTCPPEDPNLPIPCSIGNDQPVDCGACANPLDPNFCDAALAASMRGN